MVIMELFIIHHKVVFVEKSSASWHHRCCLPQNRKTRRTTSGHCPQCRVHSTLDRTLRSRSPGVAIYLYTGLVEMQWY